MALKTQPLDIPLAGGLAELVGDKLVNAPYLDAAENVTSDKQGVYRKRNGFSARAISGNTSDVIALPPTEVPSAWTRDGKFRRYFNGAWQEYTSPPQIHCEAERYATLAYSTFELDSPINAGNNSHVAFEYNGVKYAVVIWAEDELTPVIGVIDYATGITLYEHRVTSLSLFGASGATVSDSNWGIADTTVIGDTVLLSLRVDVTSTAHRSLQFYCNTKADWAAGVAPTSISQVSFPVLAVKYFGPCVPTDGTHAYFIYDAGSTPVILVKATVSGSTFTAIDSAVLATGPHNDAADFYYQPGIDKLLLMDGETRTYTVSPVAVSSIGIPSAARNVGLYGPNHDDSDAYLYTGAGSTSLALYEWLGAGTLVNEREDMGLGGRPLRMGGMTIVPNKKGLDLLWYKDSLQPAELIPIVRLEQLGAQFSNLNFNVSKVSEEELSICIYAGSEGCHLVSVKFNQRPVAANFNGATYLSGGVLRATDGTTLFETYPYNDSPDIVHTGSSGNYSWRCYLQCADRKGNVYRSAPGAVDTSSSSSLTISALPTPGSSSFYQWTAEIYRTASSGTVYFGNSSRGVNPADGSLVPPIQALDVNLLMYTEGGELPAECPPASSFILATKERLFLVPSERANEIWYSKLARAGIGAEFSSANRLLVDDTGGRIVGLAALDDKVLIFKENNIFVTYGEGFDDTGNGSNFAPPQPLQTNAGCINKHSIVSGPFGVMFQGKRGIWLVDRGLQVTYAGNPVDDTVGTNTVTQAVHLPSKNEVRFYLDTGNAAVYNYVFGVWYTHSSVTVDVAGVYDDVLYKAYGPDVRYEDATSYSLDNGKHIGMKIRTPWIKVAGVNGFQRVLRVVWLLKTLAATDNTTIKVWYNYNESSPDVHTWDRATLSAYHGLDVTQLEAHIRQQRCTAIKFEFADNASGSTGAYEGYEVHGLTLQIGAYPTTTKQVPSIGRK